VGWASPHIGKLRAGETVSFRPRGHSMKGRIESGQLCTVAPVDTSTLKVGNIVLCRVGGANTYISSRRSGVADFKLAITAVGSTAGLDQIAYSASAFAFRTER